jgi:hypothetical protein
VKTLQKDCHPWQGRRRDKKRETGELESAGAPKGGVYACSNLKHSVHEATMKDGQLLRPIREAGGAMVPGLEEGDEGWCIELQRDCDNKKMRSPDIHRMKLAPERIITLMRKSMDCGFFLRLITSQATREWMKNC